MLRLLLIIPLFFIWNCKSTNEEIKFEKIVFFRNCFNTCPVYTLQINSDKSIQLLVEQSGKQGLEMPSKFKLDSAELGYFKGQAKDALFKELINELSYVVKDPKDFEDNSCLDGLATQITIYYDGKVKHIRSLCPTINKAEKLKSILYKFCDVKELSRTNEKFKFQ